MTNMTKAITTQQFKQDVAEYQQLERNVAENFLNGLIQLGEVLHRARETWKSEGRWVEYVDTIGRSRQQVNQMIRMYEYSQSNMKALKRAGIDNWTKANVFLALPNELREELSNQVDPDMDAHEFKETAEVIKDENLPQTEIVSDEDLFGLDVPDKLAEMIESAALKDLNFAAREIRKELNKQGFNFSVQSVPIIETYLTLTQAVKTLQSEKYTRLSPSEKRYWNKLIRYSLIELTKLMNL